MTYCGKCGNQVADDKAFCPTCGAAVQQSAPVAQAQAAPAPVQAAPPPTQVAPAQVANTPPPSAYAQPAAYGQPPVQQPTQETPPAPQSAYPQQTAYPPQGNYPSQGNYPPQGAYQAPMYNAAQNPAAADAQNNKAMGIFSYLGILVLIPIFAAKESPFARYHANQGLVLAIIEAAYFIIYIILTGILTALMFTSVGGFAAMGIVTTLLGLLSIAFVVFAILGIVNAAKGECKPLPLIGKIKILK